MKYNRLVAFGCSRTYGHGLRDCYTGKDNKEPGTVSSKYAWPSIVSSLLGINCLNLSTPGSSNKRITYTIINSSLKKGDIVFVNWTDIDRSCIIKDNKITDIGPWMNDKESKYFFKISNDADLLFESNLYLRLIFLHLNDLGITNFHTISHPENFIVDNKNRRLVLNTSIEESKKNFPLAIDQLHPGEEAHAHFAQEIYREIKDRI